MGRHEDRLLNHPLRERLTELRAHHAELSDETVEAANEHSEGAQPALACDYGAEAPPMGPASGSTAAELLASPRPLPQCRES